MLLLNQILVLIIIAQVHARNSLAKTPPMGTLYFISHFACCNFSLLFLLTLLLTVLLYYFCHRYRLDVMGALSLRCQLLC